MDRPSKEEYVYQCCTCVPSDPPGGAAMVLVRRTCQIHGNVWHRITVPDGKGGFKLAYPIQKLK